MDQQYIDRHVGYEEAFRKLIPPFFFDTEYVLFKNNLDFPYDIDFVLVSREEGSPDKTIAYLDLEARHEGRLPQFPTIHVPRRDHESLRTRKKVDTYREHPNRSFHFAWVIGRGYGYLIQAKYIISSPIVRDVRDSKTDRILDVYDVPKDRCVRIDGQHELIPCIIKILVSERAI